MNTINTVIPKIVNQKKPLRVLVVGKNSAIVREIKNAFIDYDFVSHDDLVSVNSHEYEKVFIFSWSHSSLNENIDLLKKFNLNCVVFISTISVLACARRSQWASYPNSKLVCENIVLEAGGQVIRIGVWDATLLNNLAGLVPRTTASLLIAAMNESLSSSKLIFWPITLEPGRLDGIKLLANNFLNKISITLPNLKIFQIPIVFISKVFGFKDYGYTHDCLQFFSPRVLVGFGSVGAIVSSELTKRRLSHTIITSCDENIFLNHDGFKGMRIGQYKEGLSKLWHGVWVSKINDMLYKNVPIFVKRSRIPRRALHGTVRKLNFDESLPSVEISHSNIRDVRIFSNVIHLAAGVINNIKILQSSHSINTSLSDQEVGEIGFVKTNDLVFSGLIKRRLGFVAGRNVLQGRCGDYEYMIDFRPKATNAIEFDAENIYNNRSDQIIRKLIRSLSFHLINQAIFNKLGFSFDVGMFSVVLQIEVPNCIKLESDGKLSRVRLSNSIIDNISSDMAIKFKSFCKAENIRTFDAIHVHGGFNLDKYPDIQQHIKDKRLFLHGNVFDNSSLGPFHNTIRMINREIQVVRNV